MSLTKLSDRPRTFVEEDVRSSLGRVSWKVANGMAVKIVAIGDSILEGTTVSSGGGVLGVDDALSLVRSQLAARNTLATVTAVNRAVSGRTLATSNSNGDIATAIADAGDLYIIGFGHNDLRSDSTVPGTGYPKLAMVRTFEKLVRRIVDELPNADICVLLENPYSAGSSSNQWLIAQNIVFRQVAAMYDVAVADSYRAFTAFGIYEQLLSDGAHPNMDGHEVIAGTIMSMLPLDGNPASRVSVMKDMFGGAMLASTWQSLTATDAAAIITRVRYLMSGTWTSTTTAPHVSSTVGSLFRVLVYGDEVHLRLDCGAGTGTVTVQVDENLSFYTLDLTTYSSGQRYIPLVGLGHGAHLIAVTIVSGTITLRGVEAPDRMHYSPALIGARVVTTGTWTVNAAQPTNTPQGGSLTSSTLGDSVACTFFGTGLTIAHNAFSSNHFIEVQIDGGSWVSVNVAKATANGGIFRSTLIATGLAFSSHTVGVRSTGTRNTLTVYDFTALDERGSGTVRDRDIATLLRVVFA